MNSLPNKISYEVKLSQTGHKIPVINGIHLHSMYDPILEAEKNISKYSTILGTNKHILVLGLGFAYHIREIVFQLRANFGGNFKVVVIEPFKKTVDDCSLITPIEEQNVEIFNESNVETLYFNKNLVDFLMKRPSVIYHQASFNAHSQFFKSFITFRFPDDIGSIAKHIEDEKFREYLEEFPKERPLDQILYHLKKEKPGLNRDFDFLMLAYEQF